MADFKISQLPKVTAAGSDDYIIVNKDNNASSIIKVSDLSTSLGGELSDEFLSKTVDTDQSVAGKVNFMKDMGEDPALYIFGRTQMRDRLYLGGDIGDGITDGFTCGVNARIKGAFSIRANNDVTPAVELSNAANSLPLSRRNDGRIHIGGTPGANNLLGYNNYPGTVNIKGWYSAQLFHQSDDNQGAHINIYKSRGTDESAKQPLHVGDNIGVITWGHWDGTLNNYRQGCSQQVYTSARVSPGADNPIPDAEVSTVWGLNLRDGDISNLNAKRVVTVDGEGRVGFPNVNGDSALALSGQYGFSTSDNFYHIRTFGRSPLTVNKTVFGISSTPGLADGSSIEQLQCYQASLGPKSDDNTDYTISNIVVGYGCSDNLSDSVASNVYSFYSKVDTKADTTVLSFYGEGDAPMYSGGDVKIGGTIPAPDIEFIRGSSNRPLTRTSNGSLIAGGREQLPVVSGGSDGQLRSANIQSHEAGNGGMSVMRFSSANGPATINIYKSDSNVIGEANKLGDNRAVAAFDVWVPKSDANDDNTTGDAERIWRHYYSIGTNSTRNGKQTSTYTILSRNANNGDDAGTNGNTRLSIDTHGRIGLNNGIQPDGMCTLRGQIQWDQELLKASSTVYGYRNFMSLPVVTKDSISDKPHSAAYYNSNVYWDDNAQYEYTHGMLVSGGSTTGGGKALCDNYHGITVNGIPDVDPSGSGPSKGFIGEVKALVLGMNGSSNYESPKTRSRVFNLYADGNAGNYMRGYLSQGDYNSWVNDNSDTTKMAPWQDNWINDATHDVTLMNSSSFIVSSYSSSDNVAFGMMTLNMRKATTSYMNFKRYDGTIHSGGGGSMNICSIRPNSAQTGIEIVNSDGSEAFAVVADRRVKPNLTSITDAIDKIKALNVGVNGFIADEVEAVIPEMVSGTANETAVVGILRNANGDIYQVDVTEPSAEDLIYTEDETIEMKPAVYDEEGNVLVPEVKGGTVTVQKTRTWVETGTIEKHQTIKTGMLIPFLVKALQEATARIEALEAQVGGS